MSELSHADIERDVKEEWTRRAEHQIDAAYDLGWDDIAEIFEAIARNWRLFKR